MLAVSTVRCEPEAMLVGMETGDGMIEPNVVTEHGHSTEAIRERLKARPRHNYLREWIHGGLTVTMICTLGSGDGIATIG